MSEQDLKTVVKTNVSSTNAAALTIVGAAHKLVAVASWLWLILLLIALGMAAIFEWRWRARALRIAREEHEQYENPNSP